MALQTPPEILDLALQQALAAGDHSLVDDLAIRQCIEYVALNPQNRAGIRLVMACALAAAHHPAVDIRKPYTEIADEDSFSGRTYDELYLTRFIQENRLPANPTTAFLTPALRNRNSVLVPGINLVGRPPLLYENAVQLLDDVHHGRVRAETLLAEAIRWLLLMRDEKDKRMASLLGALNAVKEATSLSSEGIVALVEQHLRLQRSSRLPVLIVAAAYKAAEDRLGERAAPLLGHNAADRQTGSVGDIEVVLAGDTKVVTAYEMKMRFVTREDIDVALAKVIDSRIDNYIFITTETIDATVQDYARSLYRSTGSEFVILDCIGFLRHFLHFFHRLRLKFMDEYQTLLLAEPESAVSQTLKEAFLSMRLAAESIDTESIE